MPIYKPSELQAFLHSLGHRPNKRLSQNFIIDGNILDKCIQCAELQPGDLVIEIGPGPGALTEKLLEAGCDVIAIEKDPVFAKALQRFSSDKLQVICGDARDYSFKTARKAKVVANLPYHITSELIEKLILCSECISMSVLMVQKEAAERFNEISYFSLFLHYHAKVTYCFSVARHCFYPAPKVSSAVIRLDHETRYSVRDEEAFFKKLKEAFLQRRKRITTTLGKDYVDALVAIGKSAESRPEELTLSDWINLERMYDER